MLPSSLKGVLTCTACQHISNVLGFMHGFAYENRNCSPCKLCRRRASHYVRVRDDLPRPQLQAAPGTHFLPFTRDGGFFHRCQMAIWGAWPEVSKPSVRLPLSQPCEEAVERSSAKRQSDRIYKIFNRKVNNSQKWRTQPQPGLLQQGEGQTGVTAKHPCKGVTLALGHSPGTAAPRRPLRGGGNHS